jgi:4-hydroxybenzoate polyprenyltransferase
LGVAAHLANVLPDLREDAATGVRGLPHRLGAKRTALGGVAALLAASVVILLGPPGAPGAMLWAGFGGAVVLGGAAGFAAYRDPSSRRYFPAVIVVALLDVVLFAGSGVRL